MTRSIDLNSDLGESYGPWVMGDDEGILAVVSSANIACGGHAGDPETMYATAMLARKNGVTIGAHPGYADREGFGRRIIPMSCDQITRMVAVQIGAMMSAAALAGTEVAYVKPHGALGNLAAEDISIAAAVARAVRAISPDLALLALSGSALERQARHMDMPVYSEIFADRAYLPDGRLVPRSKPGALLTDAATAARRLVGFMETGLMPVTSGPPISLEAHSICVHGDSPSALTIAQFVRRELSEAGISLSPFIASRTI
ncbi:LamB/YcsF family protein [Pseudogemmobacter humi]|uniref:5-oxoprolinase subunit A n=1 Tax=Pseudogemmobacter humi TaxID=2483812 RepID=A0A3P5WZY0_9RHOB|nr:5-oxoprolinase subunit PxpA [Pseudogemmobacter humi]VDC28676.1 LamB/YcsF family protein [Pseudogemmobacter humi]